MLSSREKREMLEDGRSEMRRDHFKLAKGSNADPLSFDEYLLFLNQVQVIFSPFEISPSTTPTKLNKL